MPGLDGFQTLKFIMQKITNEKIKCKVVMFTNLSGNENEEKSKKLGASGYLMKANTTPREAVIRATEILMETPSEEAMKRTESIIEEIDGKFLTDCPGCGIRVEIKMNDE